MRVAGLGALLLAAACASTGDPPGGPPDRDPPRIVRLDPDSGTVLRSPPNDAEIVFDEVVSERVAAPRPDIGSAVILSPAVGDVIVDWRRNRLTIRPREGFRPGRVYHIELLPVITDLRQNRMKDGRYIVFSTGPEIPSAVLRGAVVDWPAGRAGPGALVEAVLMPDSLPYRALTDSLGDFAIRQVPPGTYLVYGVIDQDQNRRRGAREPYDTARVALADSATVELYAFTHDTTGPRLRSVEPVDSLTVRLTFDRPLDPAQTIDTSMVAVMPAADTTTRLGVVRVLTAAGYDSLKTRPAARPAPPDTAAPRRAAPGDTTRAQRMLLRRPPPTDARLIRLAEPLAAEARYIIIVDGARSLSGVPATARAQLSVPKPKPPPAPAPRRAADSTRTPADSLRPRSDTLRARPPTDSTRRPPPPPPPPP